MKKVSLAHIRLGKRLKELRSRAGMTQEDLAFIVGVDRSYMGFLERGEKNPTLDKLNKTAKALKVTLSDLLLGI